MAFANRAGVDFSRDCVIAGCCSRPMFFQSKNELERVYTSIAIAIKSSFVGKKGL